MIKTSVAFIVAVIVTYVAGDCFFGQGHPANGSPMGLTVEFGDRVDTLLHDVVHMIAIYLPLVTIGLFIAFPVAAGLFRRKPDLRLFGYMLAGFVALIAMHVIMKMVLGLTGVAPTRTVLGLFAQGVAGAVGGYIVHRLTRKNPRAY